jgi:PmbA protein
MDYTELANEIVKMAIDFGADESEAFIQSGRELDLEVRFKKVESIKQASDKGLGLRVFVDGKLGFGSTSDFSKDSLKSFTKNIVSISKETTKTEYNKLPETQKISELNLKIFDEKISNISLEEKIESAFRMETGMFEYDKRVKNSKGCSYSDGEVLNIIVNSNGLVASYKESSCGFSCLPVAEENGQKQVGYEFFVSRFWDDLEKPENIGLKGAKKAVGTLNARKVKTQKAPIIFEPTIAGSFLHSIFSALNGDNIYRKESFLADKLGEKVASEFVTLIDDPTLEKGVASRPFDSEGVPSRKNVAIENGILKNYFYDTKTAIKVGTKSTGNAVRNFNTTPHIGPSNFYLKPGNYSPEEIIKSVRNGFYVIDLIGFGVNIVNGDYSRGAKGLWIENGEIAYPVFEVTIAGNMLDMLKRISMVGNDLIFKTSVVSPTILIDEMTVSGN